MVICDLEDIFQFLSNHFFFLNWKPMTCAGKLITFTKKMHKKSWDDIPQQIQFDFDKLVSDLTILHHPFLCVTREF